MVNSLSFLPNELIVKISGCVDSKTRRTLSMVDRRIHEVVLDTVRCIRVFPRGTFSSQSYPSDIPKDILVRVIRRYPTLVEITFGLPKNCCGSGEFGVKEVPYLESLISYLESDPKKHFLSFVKKIECSEITWDIFGDFDRKAKKLNSRFFRAIGHKGLEKFKVEANVVDSNLTGTEIQPVLTNSPNLKTFVFDGRLSNQTVSLSFARQPQLSKVKLLKWIGPASTIESLRHCEKLEELVVVYRVYNFDEIKKIFLGKHLWNLKRLELIGGVVPRNDAELDGLTKKLPNIECLGIDMESISDDGMELFGRNCPNLKILHFSNRILTDSGLDRLTQHLPHLETISFDKAYNITEVGIAAIARNCNNLRFIRVVHYKKVEKSGIDALAENCPDLKGVEFSHGGPVSLEGMHHLAVQMPNLRYVELCRVRDQVEQIKGFYQRFSQFSRIPCTSTVKKLHNLPI